MPGKNVWVLNLASVDVRPEHLLEMTWTAGVRSVVRSMVHVWDVSAGGGELRLDGLLGQAARVVGAAPRDKGARALALETKDLCRRVLARAKAARGWEREPEVLDQDLHGSGCHGR